MSNIEVDGNQPRKAGIANHAGVEILHNSKFIIRHSIFALISSPPSWGLPDTTRSAGGVFICLALVEQLCLPLAANPLCTKGAFKIPIQSPQFRRSLYSFHHDSNHLAGGNRRIAAGKEPHWMKPQGWDERKAVSLPC